MEGENTVMENSRSEAYQKALQDLGVLAPHDVIVVIEGETGTGKELFVRALHGRSPRASGPLLPVNMAEISPALFESHFYGYRKGAFTGAVENREGFFEAADKGTLFLDEFNSMSLELQPKFLRVLETRTYLPVGALQIRTTGARVVLATNVPLKTLWEEGRLREDLYFRLKTHRILLPPLRERLEDLPELLSGFVVQFARLYRKAVPRLDEGLLTPLKSYHWPGNVRELSQKTSSAVLHAKSDRLTADLFFPDDTEDTCQNYLAARESWEASYFSQVMRCSGGDPGTGRRITGLSPTTYRRKMRRYAKGRTHPSTDGDRRSP